MTQHNSSPELGVIIDVPASFSPTEFSDLLANTHDLNVKGYMFEQLDPELLALTRELASESGDQPSIIYNARGAAARDVTPEALALGGVQLAIVSFGGAGARRKSLDGLTEHGIGLVLDPEINNSDTGYPSKLNIFHAAGRAITFAASLTTRPGEDNVRTRMVLPADGSGRANDLVEGVRLAFDDADSTRPTEHYLYLEKPTRVGVRKIIDALGGNSAALRVIVGGDALRDAPNPVQLIHDEVADFQNALAAA